MWRVNAVYTPVARSGGVVLDCDIIKKRNVGGTGSRRCWWLCPLSGMGTVTVLQCYVYVSYCTFYNKYNYLYCNCGRLLLKRLAFWQKYSKSVLH